MWDELLKHGASGAPQVIEWIGIALGIALATYVGRRQILKGKGDAAQSSAPIELAGAVIDRVKADEIIGALDRNAKCMVELASAQRALSRAVSANTAAVTESTEASRDARGKIEDAAANIRELTRELIRGGG